MIDYKKILLSISLLLTITISTFSQIDENMNGAKLKKMGLNLLREGDTYSAIDYFEAYLKQKQDAQIMFSLAECYRAARDYENALTWYRKAYETSPSENTKALYYIGTMLKTQSNYTEAAQYFNQFKKENSKSKKADENLKKLIKNQLASCDTAQKIMDSALLVFISHLDTSINKASVEFSPIFIDDSTFVYASLKSDTAVYTIKSDENFKTPVRQFYFGERKDEIWASNGLWNEGNFNLENINTGNGVFNNNQSAFYFTRCERNWKNKMICKIYRSEKKDGRWQEPELLPDNINSDEYTTTQPAVSIDTKRKEELLYFVSDREGGKGGLDIWYTTYNKKKNIWKAPKNCGSVVNTAGDEVTPFIQKGNQTMYFSSNGQISLGEYDVFKTIGEMSNWTPVENIGYPINSSYDDFYYVLNSTSEEGFLVSNRPGGVNLKHATCCDDIYSFKYHEIIRPVVKGAVYAITDSVIQGMFENNLVSTFDEQEPPDTTSHNYIEGSIVSLYLQDKTDKKNLVYIKNTITDKQGKYNFDLEVDNNYIIKFENFGQFNKSIEVTTKGITKSDTLQLTDVGLNVIPKEPIIVKNIYYAFDKYELTQSAKDVLNNTLVKILNESPQIIIEISAHTDSKGDDNYNMKLSQQRAESVVKYLVRKGIDSKRLYAKGYGETRPIAPNEHEDGSDYPEGREKNRRTEFKIIGSLDQYSEIIYEE